MFELLLEVGCEELPATAVEPAMRQLGENVAAGLREARLEHAEPRVFGTPRRLIVVVPGVADRQPDETKEQRGPRVSAAFDESGEPSKALLGFCRSQGVEPDDVRREDEYVWVTKHVPGRSAREVLSELLPEAVRGVSFEKSMRWGGAQMRFARPIRWILALLGGEVVPFELAGVRSGNRTRGHRFLAPQPKARGTAPDEFEVRDFDDYAGKLREAKVEFDPEVRRRTIWLEAKRVAGEGSPDVLSENDDIITENVYLTEWPTASVGAFDEAFLELPADVLTVAMKKHLKFLPIREGGRLTNRFVSIRNGGDEATVVQGNEWVLAARFNDAKFFFDEDTKHPLQWFAGRLDRIVFQEKLGTVRQKAERMTALAEKIAVAVGLPDEEVAHARRAAELAKADLAGGLVQELPALQGIIGGEYARRSGEPDPVCWAIRSHYAPTRAPDCGGARLARIVMAADRIDTLAGYLGLGLVPSGSKDPFGLRRATQLLIDNGLDWGLDFPDMRTLCEWAVAEYGRGFDAEEIVASLGAIAEGRYEILYSDLRHDLREAVYGAGWESPARVDLRATVLGAWCEEPGFVPYVRTATRAGNIVTAAQKKGIDIPIPPIVEAANALKEVETSLFEHPAEAALLEAVGMTLASAVELDAKAEYFLLWDLLGERLTKPITEFFDNVMVMVEDEKARDNRLRLLAVVASMYLRIADFSKIVIEG